MKPIKWTVHALQNLTTREITRQQADLALQTPEFIVNSNQSESARQIFMKRYFDTILQQEMLLRIVVEETSTEIVVCTVYKTPQIERYLRGL